MIKTKCYREYCTGCGLCKAENDIKMTFEDGFSMPELSENDDAFCAEVCPVAGKYSSLMNTWGEYKKVYTGYATDQTIRNVASSGGIITAVCIFLLKNRMVDGIIHTGKDKEKPWRTCTVCSTTAEEVIENAGSRYAQSMPLANIYELLKDGKKYVFVGKPCDVLALKNDMRIHPEISDKIYCTISFFCAGQPSEKANIRLIETMGCPIQGCRDLRYRGNGWPGSATAQDMEGKEYRMSYAESWGGILGRDIRKACRFCMNGTGEPADISCGDAWILGKDGEPDFVEREGINVIFARSEKGNQILNAALSANAIVLDNKRNILSELHRIQKYQYERKATMFSKCLAMKIMFRPIPQYKMTRLFKQAQKSDVSIKRQFRIFSGTIKRIIQHKM